jgi:type II secretion system protein H
MRHETGFTLIEMMVVITIIAIMSTVVAVNIGSSGYSRFLSGAEKLSGTLSAISDEAIYSGSVISCDVTPTSINCSRYRDGEWIELKMQKLVSWGWPEGFQITRISINGVPLKEHEPIRFLPSGDNGGFSMQVTDGQYSAWIDSDMAGRYKVSS